MPDGPLTGNGDVGVVASAKKEALSFYISKNDFWYAVPGREGGSVKAFAFLQMRIADDLSDIRFNAKQRILHAEIVYEIDFKNSKALWHTYGYAEGRIMGKESNMFRLFAGESI